MILLIMLFNTWKNNSLNSERAARYVVCLIFLGYLLYANFLSEESLLHYLFLAPFICFVILYIYTMKKYILLFSFFSISFLGGVFAYIAWDVDNAIFLAWSTIITPQKDISQYHLDAKILRQEVIWMALKIRWITIPDTYVCKKYFTDAIKNDWVCGAVELAADNGMITRANTKTHPGEYVTRAEALAILLKAGKTTLWTPRRVSQIDGTVWSLYQDLKTLWFTQWQADMMDSLPGCILINHGSSCEDGADLNMAFTRFQPNEFAIRSEVFEFAALILGFNASNDIDSILDELDILINNVTQEFSVGKTDISSTENINTALPRELIQDIVDHQ